MFAPVVSALADIPFLCLMWFFALPGYLEWDSKLCTTAAALSTVLHDMKIDVVQIQICKTFHSVNYEVNPNRSPNRNFSQIMQNSPNNYCNILSPILERKLWKPYISINLAPCVYFIPFFFTVFIFHRHRHYYYSHYHDQIVSHHNYHLCHHLHTCDHNNHGRPHAHIHVTECSSLHRFRSWHDGFMSLTTLK